MIHLQSLSRTDMLIDLQLWIGYYEAKNKLRAEGCRLFLQPQLKNMMVLHLGIWLITEIQIRLELKVVSLSPKLNGTTYNNSP